MSTFLRVPGIRWVAATHIIRTLLSLGALVILSRLLAPADFGVVGMAYAVVNIGFLIAHLGTDQAIIQRREVSPDFLASLFWLNLGLGAVLAVVTIFVSPIIAAGYGEAAVAPVLAAFAIVFPLSALSIVPMSLLRRTLRFKTVSLWETAATGIGCIAAIGAALAGAGMWSLVIQGVTGYVVLSGIILTRVWRPRMRYAGAEVRGAAQFGLNVTGAQIADYVSRNADDILIGRALGPANLGQYSLAHQIMMFPILAVTRVVVGVLFPSLSRVQADDARLRALMCDAAHIVALVSFPIMFGLWSVAKPFVLTVFGPQWGPAANLVLILAPIGALQSVLMLVEPVFLAKGRADLRFGWSVAQAAVFLAAFIAGLAWGVEGVALAYAGANLLLALPGFWLACRLIGLPLYRLGATLARPLVSSLVMAALVWSVRILLPRDWSQVEILLTVVPLGIAAYSILIISMEGARLRSLWNVALGRG